MKLKFSAALAMLAVAAGFPAQAKVASQGPGGFELEYEAVVPGTPADAFAAFVKIGAWWDKEHTYSGDAANMRIEARPDGCWCETLANGGFMRHMSVEHSAPGERLILAGGLGPLRYMGVSASMAVTFEAKDESTRVKLTYAVGGYDSGGFKVLSQKVDEVIGDGFARYTSYAVRAKP